MIYINTPSGDQNIGGENDSIPLQSRDSKVPAVEQEKCEKFHKRNIGKHNKEIVQVWLKMMPY